MFCALDIKLIFCDIRLSEVSKVLGKLNDTDKEFIAEVERIASAIEKTSCPMNRKRLAERLNIYIEESEFIVKNPVFADVYFGNCPIE